MDAFTKICCIGKMLVNGYKYKVFILIQYNTGEKTRLSIAGVTGPRRNDSRCYGPCGQILKFMGDMVQTNNKQGWTFGKVQQLVTIWQTYNLEQEVPEEVLNWLNELPDDKDIYPWQCI